MKFGSLLLCLKAGTCFRLSRCVFFKHSSPNVVRLTQENGSLLCLLDLPGSWVNWGELGAQQEQAGGPEVLSETRLNLLQCTDRWGKGGDLSSQTPLSAARFETERSLICVKPAGHLGQGRKPSTNPPQATSL